MNTILVTGGAGFIGSHLCESLHEDGHRVICLDTFGTGRRGNVDPLLDADRFDLVVGDVRESIEETLTEAGVDPTAVDRVYHLASRASPDDFETHPIEIAQTNARGTYNVLSFASRIGARALYASTSEVYGDPAVHPQPEAYNGNVNPRGERSPYDVSKRYGEMLTTVFARERGVDVRTVRIFNTYGPRMRPDDGRVVPTFLSQALSGEDLTVYGDGSQTRSFLYVSDQVRGLRALMDATGLAGEVLNVGSTDERSIRELADLVVDVTDTDAAITHEPLPHEDEPRRRQPDISKARNVLGWEPTVDLQEGLERTMEAFEPVRSVADGGAEPGE